MGKQLNIKDAETIRLAHELADGSGRSITAVIRTALEREAREQEAAIQDDLKFIRQLSADFRRKMPPEWHGKTSKEIMDEIYDENGLPK